MYVEATPLLNTADVLSSHVDHLREAVKNYVGPGGERYQFIDPELRNVGLVGKTPYILDGDAIQVVSEAEKLKMPPAVEMDMSPWVKPNGKWQQYEDFSELHAKFDSQLHQSGGQLTTAVEPVAPPPIPVAEAAAVPPPLPAAAAPPPLAAAESTASTMSKALGAESSAAKGIGSIEAGLSKIGGKNALIIGGVVAAAVGVGAFIHSQQKQSFVERENARRQENANKRGL